MAAAIIAAALGLSACATSDSEGAAQSATSSSAARTKVVTLGYAQEFSAYNNATNEASALANTVVLNQVRRGFYYFGPDGGVIRDTDFGTYEKTSDNPLTVRYTPRPARSGRTASRSTATTSCSSGWPGRP